MDADKNFNNLDLQTKSNILPLFGDSSSANISASSEFTRYEKNQNNVVNFRFYSIKNENEKAIAQLLNSAQKLTW
ncbi:hypothetical protein EBI00_02310 [Marinomonas hwangdonensis]|uniref:Uncharacterized protein n=1 Tax=Marinomonas hwangdonensis TaxID=1053647 RepID=A0A3M8QD69_9GAMM|nr:hypothetical protein [Marinomonas hwangdonensis]RNF52954.1 hypothetical protein EBI00_02310 [Marinomonas hwangdonensis]